MLVDALLLKQQPTPLTPRSPKRRRTRTGRAVDHAPMMRSVGARGFSRSTSHQRGKCAGNNRCSARSPLDKRCRRTARLPSCSRAQITGSPTSPI